jgi:hypothetical protein
LRLKSGIALLPSSAAPQQGGWRAFGDIPENEEDMPDAMRTQAASLRNVSDTPLG